LKEGRFWEGKGATGPRFYFIFSLRFFSFVFRALFFFCMTETAFAYFINTIHSPTSPDKASYLLSLAPVAGVPDKKRQRTPMAAGAFLCLPSVRPPGIRLPRPRSPGLVFCWEAIIDKIMAWHGMAYIFSLFLLLLSSWLGVGIPVMV
jgi:hypothetical protein